MADNKNSEWQKLDWATKVQICEQGRASENHLLHTYVVIFIALEAMLFAIMIAKGWGHSWSIPIPILGMVFAVWFACLFVSRGIRVGRWEELLTNLWLEADKSKLAEHYKGAVERRKRRVKHGIIALFLGWGWGRFKSAHWVLVTVVPLAMFFLWVLVIIGSFDC